MPVAAEHLHDAADEEADQQRLKHRAARQQATPGGRLARTSPTAQAASTSATTMIATAYGPVTTVILAPVR